MRRTRRMAYAARPVQRIPSVSKIVWVGTRKYVAECGLVNQTTQVAEMKIDSLHALNGMFSDFPSILLASCQLALYDLIQLSPLNIWFFVSFVPPRRRSPTYRSSFPCPSLSPPPAFSSLSGLPRLAVVDCSLTPKPSNWNDEMKDTWRDHDYYSYKLLVTTE